MEAVIVNVYLKETFRLVCTIDTAENQPQLLQKCGSTKFHSNETLWKMEPLRPQGARTKTGS
jgi:hypothetical protein